VRNKRGADEKVKRKIYNCNVSIYFNKQCLVKKLIPTYARINVPNSSPAAKHTQRKVQTIRIKDELKHLHIKKQDLNRKLYHQHLTLANFWGNSWNYISDTINERLNKQTQPRYKGLEAKLRNLSRKQTRTPPSNHPFFPRLINNTSITFSDTELKLLEKGTKYNLHYKPKNWLTNLALEAETAVSLLPTADRDMYRKQVSDHLQKLGSQMKTHHNPQHLSELKTIKSIRNKLQENEATITTADKGKSIVILQTQQYHAKIQDFIDLNQFESSTRNPTKPFQNQVRKTLNICTSLIPKDAKWKYTNLSPNAPTIKGLIKLHKTNQPVRPVVNWRNAPAYKLLQLLSTKIRQYANPPTPSKLRTPRN
jgi:hypothetical protein